MSRDNQRPVILVVEDDLDARNTLHDVLEDEGYTVVDAKHGREALDYLLGADFCPDLVLLDLQMPVMDGWHFLQERQDRPSLNRIPVAVLSGEAGQFSRAVGLGAQAGLLKPLGLSNLLHLVVSLLSRTQDQARPTR